jgi:hypothetical protein
MKTSISHSRFQLPAAVRQLNSSLRCVSDTRHSTLRPRPTSGVALVVTLIMLSVITFMAIALLVLSRAEHGSVATETEQTQARLAAEYGLQRAIAQTLGPILTQTNAAYYGLLVSTNYSNPLGFVSTAPGVVNVTNVNYDYKANHSAFSYQDWAENVANLWFDPRPPVFVTNRTAGGLEFRYFHNLNRNVDAFGTPVFDTTGWLGVTNNGVAVLDPVTRLPVTNYFTGDPQWVGILSSPDRPHAADNRFVARYAFLVTPAGKTLDINYMHNYAKFPSAATMLAANGDGFLRDQGVGTWEENLAAFLVDLNTNLWQPVANPYNYRWALPGNDYTLPNQGAAFEDAWSILRYRYAGSPSTLFSVFGSFGAAGETAFLGDYIDGCSGGPPVAPVVATDLDVSRTRQPWSGSYNTNHFFTLQELFDPTKTSANFATRLLTAGTDTNSTYNRYTYYRLLEQLGTDSATESGKINLNYDNLARRNAAGIASATNFYAWRPLDFFTNTANRLLANAGYNFTVTNIQVYPTNFYTPSVHRLLQVAANIYDATTNRTTLSGYPYLPSVFRPIFRKTADNLTIIAGYQEVVDTSLAYFENPAVVPPTYVLGVNQTNLPAYGQSPPGAEPLVLGIPLVIGAKKGLPNFNELAMQTQLVVERKLEFRRPPGSNTGAIATTNEMYILGITNTCGVEAWNSYPAAYPRDLEMHISAGVVAYMTNELGMLLLSNYFGGDMLPTPGLAGNSWKGYIGANNSTSFRAWMTNRMVLTNSMYSDADHRFYSPPGFPLAFTVNSIGFPVPHWFLSLRPQLRFALVDRATQRIVDYVSLDSPQSPVDLSTILVKETGGDSSPLSPCAGAQFWTPSYTAGSMWCTNREGGLFNPTFGMLNQISYCMDQRLGAPQVITPSQANFFLHQFFPQAGNVGGDTQNYSTTNTFYAPYSATRKINFYARWQANDPLVHYTVPDLTDSLAKKNSYDLDTADSSPFAAGFGGMNPAVPSQIVGLATPLNGHYRPWGGDPSETVPSTKWRLEVKDPLVAKSDDWNFPTNKFPNIGWLGRVHRGTPWQTIYLKSPDIDLNTWTNWTGNVQWVANWNGQKQVAPDGLFSLPAQDRYLLDLFSTSFNDNAALGQLSVNQEGLAAWSAILSGVIAMTNSSPDSVVRYGPHLDPVVCEPAGNFDPFTPNTWPPLMRIVNGINSMRASTNFPNHVFARLGDVLSVPELTVRSPFLNPGAKTDGNTTGSVKGGYTYQYTMGLSDEAYERIPQQILGLLRTDATPRFVIYAYGQSLKPAERSVITGGPYFQLCTNYQITAEVATRAVVRIDGAPTHPHAVIESFNVLPPD